MCANKTDKNAHWAKIGATFFFFFFIQKRKVWKKVNQSWKELFAEKEDNSKRIISSIKMIST